MSYLHLELVNACLKKIKSSLRRILKTPMIRTSSLRHLQLKAKSQKTTSMNKRKTQQDLNIKASSEIKPGKTRITNLPTY
jgi:hypothetical protein